MEQMVFGYRDPIMKQRWDRLSTIDKYNGAYYYCQEIEKFFIPTIDTDRNWVLTNHQGCCWNHSIVFVHNNIYIDAYEWLKHFDDIVLICGYEKTVAKVEHIAPTLYLPMSVDTKYVAQFFVPKEEKTKDTCYVGRWDKLVRYGIRPEDLAENIDVIWGLPREQLLPMLAQYRNVYATDRCAIEAKILGCNVLHVGDPLPTPEEMRIFDSREAAVQLQKMLDEFEGR